MCPRATDPMADLSIDCTNEERFTSLEKMNLGCPLPGNVIKDVNPFFYRPENLPPDMWYFLHLKENKVTEYGFWRPRGEPLRIFSNASIYGWETAHEYYQGQAPDCCKTEWFILEYKVTTKGSAGDAITKEARSLCKVSHNNARIPDHGVEQAVDSKNNCIETSDYSQETHLLTANKDSEKGCTSGVLQAVKVPDDLNMILNGMLDAEQEAHAEQEADCLAKGHYLELLDLENPLSPSISDDSSYLELLDLENPLSPSSSDDSSCVLSMSSGECFDALALEAEHDQKPERKNVDMRFTVSDSAQPLEIAFEANSVAALPVEESFVEYDAKDETAASSRGNPSSSSHNVGSSSSSHSSNASSSSSSNSCNAGPSSSRRPPSPDGKPKDRGNKRLKRFTKNLFCFMAF